ncbi:TRAP transporter substrate-binding protein, partial [Enterococcus lactis]|nr:TRAP transporter substrate-binding protein [Enterococcus lactis]
AQEEHGVQFNDVDNTPFREAVAPLHDTFKNDPAYKDLYQKIQEQGA